MTRQEFMQRRDDARHSERRGNSIFITALIALLIVSLLLVKLLPNQYSFFVGPTEMVSLVCAVCLSQWVRKKRITSFGLRCPTCSTPLTGSAGLIVVDTGKCGSCGAKVISDADAQPAG